MGLSPALLLKNLRKDLVEALPHMRDILDEDIAFSDDAQSIAAKQLYRSLCKKWTPSSGTPELRNTAIASFLASNAICASWRPTQHPLYSRVYQEMGNLFREHFARVDVSWDAIFDRARTGPGSSVGSRGRNSAFEKLFCTRMSTTSVPLYKEYLRYVSSRPLWHAAEKRRVSMLGRRALRIVEGSTVSTVRKNVGTDRTICTEATLNMIAQLGLGEIFNEVLKAEYGYDSALQPSRNVELARRGSRSGDIATIDCTNSSDLIAKMMVYGISDPVVAAALDDVRSERAKVNGEYIELHMISSMGNGFTFPLMTYLYALCLEALCRVLGRKFVRFDSPGTPFGVFGDDIICPSHLYEPMCQLLTELGFQPNLEKSFARGFFRESCGGDFYKGVNVRGVYIKSLDTDSSRYSAINSLNFWSARHFIPLRRLIRLLLPRGWRRHIIPTDESFDSGVMMPVGPKADKRGHYVYECLESRASQTTVYKWKSGCIIGFIPRYDNPMGALLCTINGSLRSGCISRRQTLVQYSVVTRSAPFWARSIDLGRHGVIYDDWSVFVTLNVT